MIFLLGLITEYNPFHNGHKLHIDKSKEKTKSANCIVVMSGNFTQRGEPAIFDKHLRTKMALLNSADIVLELPTTFATSSAELFALGAIDILDKTNMVSKICFGSEQGDISSFIEVSDVLNNEPISFKNNLAMFLSDGLSFPDARLKALEKTLNKDLQFLKNPNNILSLEYIKAIHKLNSSIKPFTILREKSNFHSKEIKEDIASATAIREALYKKDISLIEDVVPKNCLNLFKDNLHNQNNIENYANILSFILRSISKDDLKNIADITEGLENKILSNIDFIDISNLILNIKSKRYTYTKLQRAILHIILNITKETQDFYKTNLNSYIRVLGFRKESSHILSELTKKAKVPVVTNLKNIYKTLDPISIKCIEKDIIATDIYYLPQNKPKNYEFSLPLVIV